MESGIIPAIISFLLPGLGQAITEGKSTWKWVLIFIIVVIVEIALQSVLGQGAIYIIISLIISIIFAYDAYADMIDI